MKKKIGWLMVTCLMALSLVIASCAPASKTPTATTQPRTTVAPTTATAPTATATAVPKAPAVDKPKYGGVLLTGRNADIVDFDDIVGLPYAALLIQVTNDALWDGDWTKGPAGGYGSNETYWDWHQDRWDHKTGYLAESWELAPTPDGGGTVVWHLRQGIRFALNPDSEASRLVGGREVISDDVVFSLNQQITDKRAFVYRAQPELRTLKISASDKYTVKFEVPPGAFEAAVSRLASAQVVPPEVVKKYGEMRDWRVSVGSGSFMLTEYIPGSSATLVRNPKYWMKNPIGPGKGDQLPYLDAVKILIIPDTSTRLAALRTAKLDHLGYHAPVGQEDAVQLRKQLPKLLSLKTMRGGAISPISMKLDKPPFNDIRVRRALFMATDFESIKNQYFKGDAQIITYPIGFDKAYASAYLGLDDPDMPASIRELYVYNVEKAKALLKEAGYPQGFKTKLIFENAADQVDYFSIIKDMWAKIGVELTLETKEKAVYDATVRSRNFEGMIRSHTAPTSMLYKLVMMRGADTTNPGGIADPVVESYYSKIQAAAGLLKWSEADQLHRELMKYALDQAWQIPVVGAPYYYFWWPWLKNYSGEAAVGYNNRHFFDWVWLDQELKKSMGF
ncbi:MAG: ABC transporter substrate-binding protein [Chloroflexi bacterium]|nr:ABC transporter substrate-binding protein [Chloroflexota bacterium]